MDDQSPFFLHCRCGSSYSLSLPLCLSGTRGAVFRVEAGIILLGVSLNHNNINTLSFRFYYPLTRNQQPCYERLYDDTHLTAHGAQKT